ncbi:hypothetical protein pb186bvf_018753 [Paramecium bursaria]
MDTLGNTYVLEPKEEEKFYPSKVKRIIQEVLEDKFKNETQYDQNTTPIVVEELIKKILKRIRETIKMPRYKLCCQVYAGEIKGQGVKVTSKCLWDTTWDNYASYQYTNEFMYAVGIVFGVYYE